MMAMFELPRPELMTLHALCPFTAVERSVRLRSMQVSGTILELCMHASLQ